ncbi:glycosyltransferase family 39 protein [uncultured Roseibium sp.]|uniref:glycosyltransferase family 39 protein n=1 Tax=uncultured Roseibium sp. TaxID=1936171 RepID=UPI0025947ED9|nr:glycosyltransferase family 39 protein [uncultured Roseibium sp.]
MTRKPADLTLPVYLRPVILVVFVAALTGLKLWSAANAHFVEDEAYYRLWGLSPALGYYDHPPMIAWWIWAGQAVFGDTPLGVRALVVFSSALGSFFLWRTADILFDRLVAGWSVLFLNASILVGVGGILATPDAPSVFFWGLALWALAELHSSQKPNWLLAVGLFAGLGLDSKYSVLFLGAGITLWLVLVPSARHWFRTWQLWAGGLIALLCFVPVLYWNHLHDWVSFYKQFGRAAQGGWTSKYIFEFIGAVLGLANPLIAILAVLGAFGLGRKAIRGDAGAGLLILTISPFLAYLLFHSLHARVQANWPAPLFPTFALMAAWFVGTSSQKVWRYLALAGVILGVVVAVIVQVHAVSPISGKLARKDPTFQLRGWPEAGEKVAELAYKEGAAYIATTGYGLNGQLAFLFAGDLPVIQLNERIRYAMEKDVDDALFERPGLYVSEERRDDSAALSRSYKNVEKLAVLPRTVKGVLLENLVVYVVSDPVAVPLEPVNNIRAK